MTTSTTFPRHWLFPYALLCLVVCLSSLTAVLPSMDVAAASHVPVAPVFHGNSAQTSASGLPHRSDSRSTSKQTAHRGHAGRTIHSLDTIRGSGADQPGYGCAGQVASDNSSEYSGPSTGTLDGPGTVSGDIHTYTGTADQTGKLRIDVTNNSTDTAHWVEAHVSALPAGFDWGIDSDAANFYYNYNISGFDWDGSQWRYKYMQNNYTTLGVQPGSSAWMAWYMDCTTNTQHFYLGSSATQLVEVGRAEGGLNPPWYVGLSLHSAANASVSIDHQSYSSGIPANVEIIDWNGSTNTVVGSAYLPPTDLLGLNDMSAYSTTCNCADPVNTATGNFVDTFDEVSIPGRGIPLDLNQTYNALTASQDSPLGFGWTDSYNLYLSTDSSGDIAVHQENGSTVTFTCAQSGCTAPAWVLATLVQNSDGTYTFTRDQSQEQFVFSAPTPSAAGQLLKEVDRNGYTTTLTYNNGQLTTVTDPAGRTLTFTYNASNRIASVADSSGRSVSYTYDSSGNLADIVDVGGGDTHFTYGSSHLLLTMEDPDQYQLHDPLSSGAVTTNVYDSIDRVISQTDPLGRTMTFGYVDNPNGTETTTITDPKGNIETQTYANFELQSDTEGSGTPQAATWTFAYDPTTRGTTTVTDPDGHTTTNTYDSNGNLLTQKDALGHATSYTYDSLSDVTSVTDPSNVTTTLTYDGNGNLLSVSRPLSGTSSTATVSLSYDAADNLPEDVSGVTDPNGNQTTFTYDRYGDPASETDADGNRTTYTYDSIGRPLTMVSPRGNAAGHNPATSTTSYQTDAFGAVTSITDPLGNQTILTYDPNGNLLTQKDALGHVTTNSYDADNELTGETLADTSSWGMAYDGDGNVVSQSNGLGQTTTYSYNSLNELVAWVSPCGTVPSGGSFCASGDSSLSPSALATKYTTSYAYDLAGNLQSTADPLARTTTYSYDADNELCAVDYTAAAPSCTGTRTITESYDALGERTGMTDTTGTSTFVYDSLGRLTSSTDGGGHTVAYGYDLNGNVTSLTYPDNTKVTRTYDAANQLTDVTDWKGNDTHFSYDADGNLTSESFPSSTNGAGATFSYNAADELTKIIDARSAGSGPFRWVFGSGRDALGQVSSATDRYPGMRLTYTYDALNRLTLDTRSNRTLQSWSYNAADELTSSGDTAAGTTSTYGSNGGDELTSLQTTQGSSTLQNLTLSYNTVGDRTGQVDSVSGTNLTFGYNQADELSSFSNSKTGVTAGYTYNGDGLRVSKTVSGSTTAEVWNLAEGLPLMIQDGSTKYVTGPYGLPIEQVDNSGTIAYYLQDQLGSTRGLIDSSGNIVGIFNYDAYGNPTGHTGTVTTPFGYAGQYADSESGLQYLRVRYYDPSTAQFLTVDPAVAVTGEPYSYAADDPTNISDPSGLCPSSAPRSDSKRNLAEQGRLRCGYTHTNAHTVANALFDQGTGNWLVANFGIASVACNKNVKSVDIYIYLQKLTPRGWVTVPGARRKCERPRLIVAGETFGCEMQYGKEVTPGVYRVLSRISATQMNGNVTNFNRYNDRFFLSGEGVAFPLP